MLALVSPINLVCTLSPFRMSVVPHVAHRGADKFAVPLEQGGSPKVAALLLAMYQCQHSSGSRIYTVSAIKALTCLKHCLSGCLCEAVATKGDEIRVQINEGLKD